MTQHYDNARTGQNTNETILTPASVNPRQFGKLFTQNLDGQEAGQPLYVPAVFIPAANSTHSVVYVATQHDSVYAFDAENNQGSNASPLWQVNFLDPANGITTVPVADEQCYIAAYTEFGIQGTPVIDMTRNAIYVLAMTKENGAYVHKLHALDLGTGAELFGGPVTVTASVTINNQLYPFIDRYQQQRPGLLLQNGIVYIGFGSPGCNSKTEMGWVMAYDAGTLQQVGFFNVSPGVGASAIWMSGAGLAGDGAGNVYFSTGDGLFDVDSGGNHYGDSILKLSQGNGVLNLADYFTPYNQGDLQINDLDLGSGQVLLLPEGPQNAFTLAVDKNGTLYLLDQENLGQFNPFADSQIAQEVAAPVSGEVHAGLTYWNNTVYVAADQTPVMAYSFTNGQLSLQPISQTPKATANPTAGIVSSNGASNGILWYITAPTAKLFAFAATNLAIELYDNAMAAGSRDALGPVVHFEMPIVADGRVYVNGRTQLTVFGLLPVIAAAGGNNQTGVVGTTLPVALQAALDDPYTGQQILTPGIPVTFSASGKAGSFSNPNAITQNSGTATTSYTLSARPGTYAITASSPGYTSATFVVTATAGGPTTLSINSGSSQKQPVKSLLPLPLKVRVKDALGNAVSGILVSFSDGGAGGNLPLPTATTDSSGFASTSYTTGTKSGVVGITASVASTSVIFKETVLAGPAASASLYAGNNQTVKPGTATSKLLQVIVNDQYGNPVPGISVTFDDGGAGGSFLPDPVATNSKGIAGTRYTAPTETGTVTVRASSAGAASVLFTVTVN